MMITPQQQQKQEGVQLESKEMNTLQMSREKNDEERRRLAEHIAVQEAQLQQLLRSDKMQIEDEHYLEKCIEILRDLDDSRKCLAEAEEECHVIATKVMLQKLLQNEASYSLKHAPAVISEARAGSCKVCGTMHVLWPYSYVHIGQNLSRHVN